MQNCAIAALTPEPTSIRVCTRVMGLKSSSISGNATSVENAEKKNTT